MSIEDEQNMHAEGEGEGEDAHLEADDVDESYDQGEADDDAMSDISASDADEPAGDAEEDGQADQDPVHDDSVQGFFDHTDSIYCVALHPDGVLCATGAGDETVNVWSTNTGELVRAIKVHEDSVTSIAFSSDGSMLASAGMDGSVHVWRVASNAGAYSVEDATVLEPGSEVMWMSWHPAGLVLIAGTQDGLVWMWRLPKGDVMNTFAGHTGACTGGAWSTDGKSFTTCGEDAVVIRWDPRSGQPSCRLDCGNDERLAPGNDGAGAWNVVAVDATGNIAAVGSSEGLVKVLNLQNNGQLLASLEAQSDSIEAVAYSQGQPALLACASVDGTVAVYEAGSLRLRTTLRHDDAVVSIHFEPNTPFLFTASTDRSCRQWDVRTGAMLKQWFGSRNSILCMAVAKGGKKIVAAGDDSNALVFT